MENAFLLMGYSQRYPGKINLTTKNGQGNQVFKQIFQVFTFNALQNPNKPSDLQHSCTINSNKYIQKCPSLNRR